MAHKSKVKALPSELQRTLDNALEQVPRISIWTHNKTGDAYVVCYIAFRERDLTVQVIYSAVRDNFVWVRPIGEFLERFTKETIR